MDAGEVNVAKQRQWWTELGPPYNQLQAVDPYPNTSKRPSEWILDYMDYFWPHQNRPILDYLLVTHFHSDHFGDTSNDLPRASNGNHSLSGVPAIANNTRIGTLIDRGYPEYNFPRDLRHVGDATIDNYLKFVNASSSHLAFEQFQVGSTRQIHQVHNNTSHNFEIQVLKSSATVLLQNGSTAAIPGSILDEQGQWNENTMSAAFRIRYGNFTYYEGGDQEIVRDKDGLVVFDTIGPTARIAGRVDVASLNHHGHDVTHEFVQSTNARIWILQGWCSDQAATSSMELLSAATSKQSIFATHLFPDRIKALGPSLSKLFASTEGHVVVRVHPQRPKTTQLYEVFVLDGDRKVKSHHGPYPAGEKTSAAPR